MLLEAGADDSSNSRFETSLSVATRKRRADKVRLLEGAGSLWWSASTGNTEGLKTWLEEGLNPDVRLSDGSTPLMRAALSNMNRSPRYRG